MKAKQLLPLLFFFMPWCLSFAQPISWSLSAGAGYTTWVDVLKNITFYDAAGNIIDNTQIKTIGKGPCLKLESGVVYQFQFIRFGAGIGFQRDFIDDFKTESDNSLLVENDTTQISKKIYEAEYYLIIGFNLFETAHWNANLNLNGGSFYLHSDYATNEIKNKFQTAVECEFNYMLSEDWYFQLKPRYEYAFLSLSSNLVAKSNWNLHNVTAMVGVQRYF